MKLPFFNPGRRIRLFQVCAAFAATTGCHAAFADGRVVVVGPNQGPQPIGPNEKVTAGKTVTINGGPVTIVRVEPMPPKPKFVIGMPMPTPPGGFMYFPYPPDRDEDGVHISFEHLPGPGGSTVVVLRRSIAGGHADVSKTAYPPGSIIIPDPPQPLGLNFMADRYPADPVTESAVLASLGLPDNPESEVWVLVTGDLYFFTDHNPPGPPVHISPAIQTGDLNCDGVVDDSDVDPFIQALIDPAGYEAINSSCGTFYGDLNGDAAVNALDIGPFIGQLSGY